MSPRARVSLALILLVALVLDFLFYTGFFASDDLQYLTGARGIARLLDLESGGVEPGMGNSRLGVTVPAGAVFWATGGSVAAVAWFHVLYHLALVVLAFALGRLFHGERAGLIASAITATSPILYFFAGAILPDQVTAVWLALILLLLELLRRREANGPLGHRRAFRWYVGLGLLFGVAYSCKDTALIMTVPAAVLVMASAPSLRSPVWVRNGAFMAAGLLAFFLLELLALRGVTGTWVFRPTMVGEVGDVFLQRMETQGGANPLSRMWFAVGDRLASLAPLTTWLLLAAAVAYGFARRRHLSVLLFFWWPFLYMTFGTTSFSSYRPPSIQTRYYGIVIVPAAVMAAAVAQEAWQRWGGWSRVPSALRGRLAAGALALALLAAVAHELIGNLPRSGNIYKAPFARALVVAYETARDRYPQYPIVIGSDIGPRTRSLLVREAGDGVTWAGDGRTPGPPYLLVALGDAAPQGDDATLGVELLESVRPPRSRFDVVIHELSRLFALRPSRTPTPHPSVAATISLVSRAGEAAAPSHRAAGPWIATRDAPQPRELGDGHLVEWDAAADFTLALFETGGYEAAPRSPAARLPRGAPRVRLAVDVRLLRGNEANVQLHGFGYDAGGTLVARSESTATLLVGAAPTRVAIDLESPRSIEMYRLRLRVKRARRAGALFAVHPVIELDPGPER